MNLRALVPSIEGRTTEANNLEKYPTVMSKKLTRIKKSKKMFEKKNRQRLCLKNVKQKLGSKNNRLKIGLDRILVLKSKDWLPTNERDKVILILCVFCGLAHCENFFKALCNNDGEHTLSHSHPLSLSLSLSIYLLHTNTHKVATDTLAH